jgi:hypothetical protein
MARYAASSTERCALNGRMRDEVRGRNGWLRVRSCRATAAEGRRRWRIASKERRRRRDAIREKQRVQGDREGTHKVVRHRSRLFLIAGRAFGPVSLRRMRHDILLLTGLFLEPRVLSGYGLGTGKEGQKRASVRTAKTGTKGSVEICRQSERSIRPGEEIPPRSL